MAIDYETLVGDKQEDGAIKQWMNRQDIPATIILTMAQETIYQKIRVRQMLKTLSSTLAAGDDTIALDATYRQPYFFMFTGTSKSFPKRKLLDDVIARFTYDAAGVRTPGKPQFYATDEANIQFEVLATEAYPYLFRYYGSLTALSEANPTNFLTDRYPALLMAACMFRANEWAKDERQKVYWLKILDNEVLLANRESDQELAGVEMDMVVAG